MRIAICDDEPKMQECIEEAIKDWANSHKYQMDILKYPDAESFLFVWPNISFDLAFLDIKMKTMDGVELAEHIRRTDKDMMIVFVTSFKQYVLKGYDVNALHYLIKPLSVAKLLPILDRAHMVWNSYKKLALLVSDKNGQVKIMYNDIYYISMFSHMASIHTLDKSFKWRKTADELLELLPDYFVRCHRSYIVNLLKTDCVYKDSLLLSNGEKIPVSRNNSKKVNDTFTRLYARW